MILLTLALLSFLPLGTAMPADDDINAHVESAMTQLQRFEATNDPDDMKKAIAAMEGTVVVDKMTVERFVSDRRRLVYGYANILKAIEQSYDASYDPQAADNRAYISCPPPDCSSPEAIRKNNDNIRRANVYERWRRIDDYAMALLESTLTFLKSVQPCTIRDDSDALRATFQSAGLSRQHLERIEKTLGAPAPSACAPRLIDNAPHLAWSACKVTP